MTFDKPVSASFIGEFGQRWSAAWNSHNTDQVLALLHDDIEWDDTVFWPDVIVGIGGMRPYVDMVFRVMPDVHFEEIQLFTAEADGRALWLFRQSGSAPAKFGDGKSFSSMGCDIFLGFTDGKLSRYLAQYEITDMMRQYGALPAREGRIGGSYLLSLLGAGATT
ncbi:nuclear transport factor 2 family protein [Pseudarthrobacter sp. NIBRBAC000502772]|uniref:nuclear transport factor 2 family protein n=1 Tax=Pseudarthrobacter sp. NIBRBAC000502772 TaxID=2590775 RepID=UPI00113078F7|nr:nuclear transport factor 2 family protein [Pseudarthrobacter sp. NIBRBAC000502772]QDG66714.1 nuclear transport factor 2 family protein [Pseudarthrobacter sp. NIBRBAC000502772]